MFSKEQIQFMKDVIGLRCDFNNLSDDDYVEIEEKVGDKYTFEGVEGEDCMPNEIGLMCESILDHIDD